MKDPTDYETTVGNHDLCAWAVAPCRCHVQVRNPAFLSAVKRIDSARLVAYSVAGGFLRIFAIPFTLPWTKSAIEKLILDFQPKSSV